VCQNRFGAKFNRVEGDISYVWVNGKVKAIYSIDHYSCSDGSSDFGDYIIKEAESVDAMRKSIRKYIKEMDVKRRKRKLMKVHINKHRVRIGWVAKPSIQSVSP
jgi:hypothetical protein